jgi:hypothetical protein
MKRQTYLELRYAEVRDQIARLLNEPATDENRTSFATLEDELQRIADEYASQYNGVRPPPPPPPPPPWWFKV